MGRRKPTSRKTTSVYARRHSDEDNDVTPKSPKNDNGNDEDLVIVPPVVMLKDKGRESLLGRLFKRRQVDVLSDLNFVIGDNDADADESPKAHMLIVREGSKVLEEMIEKRKLKGAVQIVVPKGISGTAFEKFLQFLYSDNPSLASLIKASDAELISLLALGDHFDVGAMREECSGILMRRLKASNCVEILQGILPLTKGDLFDAAQELILRKVDDLMDEKNDLSSMEKWSWILWRLLLPKLSGNQLLKAFKAMKRWKEADFGSQESFARLGACVNFRSFGSAAAVADNLQGTGLLKQNEMLTLFMHFAGGEKTITVKAGDNLQKILDSASTGSRILLPQNATFSGDFSISKNDLKLFGGTLKGRLVIDGDECELADCNILGIPKPEETSAVVLGGTGSGNPIIVIKGNSNILDNIVISLGEGEIRETEASPKKRRRKNSAPSASASSPAADLGKLAAILCIGNDNKLSNISLEAIPNISINGDGNKLNAISIKDAGEGVIIQGNSNIVNDLLFFPESSATNSAGVCISEGSENVISHLNYVQFPNFETAPGPSMLELGPQCCNTKVRYCSSGPVSIGGKGNEIIGVRVRPKFKFVVTGSSHQFVDCGAEQFSNSGKNVTMTNCEFY